MDANTPPKKSLKVLFVDNSRTIRAAMAMFLERNGHQITAVGTGQEAIEQVQLGIFDVVIMDLYMPLMNGHEAAKIIRTLPNKFKDIPIIALTASEDQRDMEIAHNAGMNEYIIKTEDNKELIKVLEDYRLKFST